MKVYGDSQLVVGQINGTYEVQEESMKKYLKKMKSLISVFSSLNIQQIPGTENTWADLLLKLATLVPSELPKEIFFEVLKYPRLEESQTVMQVNHEPSWVDPLILYFKDGILPRDLKEA